MRPVAGLAKWSPAGHIADMTLRCRLAIFDFDGTLADSLPWFRGVFAEVAEKFAFRPLSPHDLEALRGCGPMETMERLGVPAWKVPLIARHLRHLKARDVDRILLFPGVGDALHRLKAKGVKVAIVTSDVSANVHHILGPAHARLIDHFACGASLFGKAAKFRRVLRRCGVEARDALAIGDEVRDIEAARQVGLPFAGVAWGYALPEALAAYGPEALFESVAEIGERLAAP